MTRMTKLLFIPGILLLLLAGAECAPKKTTEEPPEKYTKPPVRNEPTLPPKKTTKWHEPQQRQTGSCSVIAGPVVASSGDIGIGSIGGSYNNNEYCVWEIQVPEGLIIRFTWEYFELEGSSPNCLFDYVDISDYETGDSLTGRLCGTSIPMDFNSSSNAVRVIFKSDSTVTKQGFALHFEAASDVYETTEATTTDGYETTWLPQTNCSVETGRIEASSGEIGIGSIGGSYNNNEYCVWEIEVPEGLRIRFTWEYFELEGPSPTCPFDYVDISDYETGDSLTGRLCGGRIRRAYRSRSNAVRVTFSSDFSVTLQGFALHFEAASGCSSGNQP